MAASTDAANKPDAAGLPKKNHPELVLPTKPNIVIIMTDDLDLKGMQSMIAANLMPNLSKMIAHGTTFSNYFVVSSLGCPDRQSYLTGQYYHNLVPPNKILFACNVIFFNDKTDLPNWLKGSGYRTSLMGRYLDGYGYNDINGDGVLNNLDVIYIPPNWDNWEAMDEIDPLDTCPPNCAPPPPAGAAVAAGQPGPALVGSPINPATVGNTRSSVNPYVTPLTSKPPTVWVSPFDPGNMYEYDVNENGTVKHYGTDPSSYQTDVLAAKGAAFIQNSVTQFPGTPFFLYIAEFAPHVEVFPPWSTFATYASAFQWDTRPAPRHIGTVTFPLPQPPSFNQADVSLMPKWLQAHPPMTSTDIAGATTQYQNREATLRAVDDMVGTIENAVAAAGQTNNTIIFLTSDNGWFYGEHRLSSKLAAYEEAIRVPLYMNVGQGQTIDAMVTSIDLAPTFAELAQATPLVAVDGKSFVPLLSAPTTPWRKRFLEEHDQFLSSNPLVVPRYSAVRSGSNAGAVANMLYTEYADPTQGNEFYDLNSDPYEMTNLYTDNSSTRTQQRAVLKKQVDALKNCANGTCQTIEFQ